MQTRRKKGTGYITKVNDSTHANAPYKAVFPLPNGKNKTKYFSKESEATAWLRNINADSKAAQALSSGNITYGAYSELYLDYKRDNDTLKPSSFKSLALNIHRASDYIGAVKIRDIDNNTVQAMVRDLAKNGYSRSVMEKSVYAVTAVLGYAASQKDIPSLPIINVIYPYSSSKDDRDAKDNWLRPDESDRYIAECVRTYVPKKYTKHAGETLMVHDSGYKLALLMHTGIRLGEALALTWDKFDDYSKTLLVDQSMSIVDGEKLFLPPKTKSGERLIVLNRQALQDIYKLKEIFDKQTSTIENRRQEEIKAAEMSLQGPDLKVKKRMINNYYDDILKDHHFICGSSTFPYGAGDPHSLNTTHRRIRGIVGINHIITVHGLRHTYVTQYYLRHKNDPDFDLPTFSRSI